MNDSIQKDTVASVAVLAIILVSTVSALLTAEVHATQPDPMREPAMACVAQA